MTKSYITKQPAIHHHHSVGDFCFCHEVEDSIPRDDITRFQTFVREKDPKKDWVDGRAVIPTKLYLDFSGIT